MKVLDTERLALRRLVPSDAAFILRLLNDPGWIQYIGDRGVRTVEAAGAYLEARMLSQYERFGFGLWSVEPRAGGEPMGICGLVKRDNLPVPDLGFAFLPEFRGRGYAYESALGVRDHATQALGIARLLAITSPENGPSARLLERLGFVAGGEMPWAGNDKDPVTVYAYGA
jgi:[ribosomal protein S5]-alanine N-acetyltransferase